MKNAPAVHAPVLLTTLTDPHFTAHVSAVLGYDARHDAWKVALALLGGAPQQSGILTPATPRTAWIRALPRYGRAPLSPEWEAYDIASPLAA